MQEEPSAAESPFHYVALPQGRLEDVRCGPHPGFVLLPRGRDDGGAGPWVWYAPVLAGHNPNRRLDWLFGRLLAAGVAVGGVDVGESYGSPAGREIFTAFCEQVVARFALAARPGLLAQSRGALMLYNWAAEHPEKICCIGGIYPVCDLRSFPGLDRAAPAYAMAPRDLERRLNEHNPIYRLGPLADAGVPILHLHGDCDQTVPLESNSAELTGRYRSLGGRAEVIVVAGKGHQEIDEFFQRRELLRFLIAGVGGRAGDSDE